jgi:hypothetical protein
MGGQGRLAWGGSVAAWVLALGGVLAPAWAAGAPAPPSSVMVTVDAAAPGPPIDESLVGVNHVRPGTAPALRAIGTRWARTDVSFEATVGGHPVYDCATGAWDPSFLDSQVALDRQAGAEPELIVDYSPPCLTADPTGPNPSYSPPDLGANAPRWSALVYQMARHEIADEGVRTFEVWNEPDGFFFWTGTMAQYLDLYAQTAGALEQAARDVHARIEVGGPALADVVARPNLAWVDALLGLAATRHVPLDFLSWHVYANDPYLGPGTSFGPLCFGQPPGPDGDCWYNPALRAQLYGEGVSQVAAEVAKFPGLHPKLWIDEWNVDAGFDPRQDGTYGAAFVAAVLDSVQAAGLDRMSFYEATDDPGSRYGDFGILTAGLSPKPDYFSFRFWHQLAGRSLAVSLAPDQSGQDPVGRVGAVASRGQDGRVSVLVYNFAPQGPSGVPGTAMGPALTHHVVVRLEGLRPGRHDVSRYLVDTSHRGDRVLATDLAGRRLEVGFDLEGQGVSLLSVSPEDEGRG